MVDYTWIAIFSIPFRGLAMTDDDHAIWEEIPKRAITLIKRIAHMLDRMTFVFAIQARHEGRVRGRGERVQIRRRVLARASSTEGAS